MNVAVCHLSLRLHGNQSLKGKRQIAKSLIARAHAKFNVSIAEIDHNDLWQRLTLGIACVSNNPQHANEVLSKVVHFINQTNLGVELLEYEVEVVAGV